MKTCKMCSREFEKLVKSHVIPESFFRAIKKESDHLLVVSSNKDEHTKKSRIGIYDQEILCLSCEEKFKPLDDYGQKILLQNQSSFRAIFEEGGAYPVGWVFEQEVDFVKLKMFFCSVLFRADISENIFYQHVVLGPYQTVLKDMIDNNVEDSNQSFTIFIRKFDIEKNKFAREILLDPRPIRIDGVRFYQIYFGSGYVVYIKVDKLQAPSTFQRLLLGMMPRLYMVSGDLDDSAELSIIKKIGESLREKQTLQKVK
ncbi:MAG: hypothetical protein HGB18_01585 [Candidatus Moranbacteria bacterium]|nr:hypothetical protein [Candidatus Moranbacteria bacterium]